MSQRILALFAVAVALPLAACAQPEKSCPPAPACPACPAASAAGAAAPAAASPSEVVATIDGENSTRADLRGKHQTVIKLAPPVVAVSDAGRVSRGGGADAPILIVAFSDYECPFCKKSEEVVAQVMKTYGNKIRYVHRDYPLPFHKSAR